MLFWFSLLLWSFNFLKEKSYSKCPNYFTGILMSNVIQSACTLMKQQQIGCFWHCRFFSSKTKEIKNGNQDHHWYKYNIVHSNVLKRYVQNLFDFFYNWSIPVYKNILSHELNKTPKWTSYTAKTLWIVCVQFSTMVVLEYVHFKAERIIFIMKRVLNITSNIKLIESINYGIALKNQIMDDIQNNSARNHARLFIHHILQYLIECMYLHCF